MSPHEQPLEDVIDRQSHGIIDPDRCESTERIRILHVITRLVVGGAQENTLLTIAHLDRVRYEVTLASGPTSGPEGSLEGQIPTDIPFERIPELIREPHPVKDFVAVYRLYTLMQRNRYHIVHTHTTKAGMVGRTAARLARIPVLVHTPHGHAFHDYLNPFGSHALKCVERRLACWTDRTICLTEAERKDYLRFRIGPPEQFEVIHSGVDIERFGQARIVPEAKRRALGLPQDGPLVGCIARLTTVKGVQYLLEAVPSVRAAIPQATVVFVGDGPLRSELERRAVALGLSSAVVFLGLRRDIPEIIPLFDVVIVPSLNEGMGRVAVEAFAAGRPVIGSRISGLTDVIADGKTGLLVPPANHEALAQAIIRCLSTPELTSAMSMRARREVGGYGVAPMIAKIDRLYDQLLTTLRARDVHPNERSNSLNGRASRQGLQ